MFKNKHFILALIIAPILAIIAYFGVDLAVSEKGKAAREGETYKLAARSNCRYTSGLCSLENGEFKLKLRSELLNDSEVVLKLTSAFALDGAKISLVEKNQRSQNPIDMEANNDKGTEWLVDLPAPRSDNSEIHLAVSSGGTWYYGETPTTFVEYKTFFSESEQEK